MCTSIYHTALHYNHHLLRKMVAAGIFAFLAAPIVAPFILTAAGFGSGGVIAGSAAAAVHSGIGKVAAGSMFATAQSAGAAGVTGLQAVTAGGVVAKVVDYVTENPVKSAATFGSSSTFLCMFMWMLIGAYVGDWLEELLFRDA